MSLERDLLVAKQRQVATDTDSCATPRYKSGDKSVVTSTALYLAYHLGTLFLLRVPFCAFKFVLPSHRPSPTWSWLNSIAINVKRDFVRIGTHGGVLQSRKDVTELPSAEQIRRIAGNSCKAVWIEPIQPSDVWGQVKELMVQNGVTPVRVAAYWWGKNIGDEPVRMAEHDEKILVHFHGGGYVMGTACPGLFYDPLARSILKRVEELPLAPLRRVLDVEYRLTRAVPIAPANAFPAALLDGVSVVYYLVFSLGFHPRNIILSGDSAGGNLALAVTRYLRDAPLPREAMKPQESPPTVVDEDVKSLLPGGMILLSPWCDIASTHIPERLGPNCSYVRNAATDFIGANPYSKERPYMGISAYCLRGLSGMALTKSDIAMNPFLSPGSLDLLLEMKDGRKTFADYPPTYVSVGGREILYDEILLTSSRIQGDAAHERITDISSSSASAGDKEYAWVTVDEEPDMFHDFAASPVAKAEALRTFNRIAHWIAALPPGREYPL